MGPDAQLLPQFMGQAADIGSRRHPAAEIDQRRRSVPRTVNSFTSTSTGCKLDLLLLAGQLVGRNALDLLGGKRWRNLLDEADKAADARREFLQVLH